MPSADASAPAPTERDVTTPDGRTLRVALAGDPGGIPIVVHHGSPGGRLLYGPHAQDARRRGALLIGYDRPGFGGSTPHPGRDVAGAARDVEAIADALGIERLAVWGISGGGPHALACAALLPGRVFAAASLAGVAPSDADGLDWLDGMGESNVEEFGAARAGRDASERFLAAQRAEMLAEGPEQLAEALRTLLSPVDEAVFTAGVGEFLFASMRAALAGGVEGWVEDDLAFTSPWGFDPGDIAIPVAVWQGRQDRFVPPAHGEWLAARIPGCDAHISPDDGHLTLKETRIPAVHEWLLAHAE